MLETRTWYGIPHSVTIGLTPRGDKLYIRGTEQGSRLDKGLAAPYSKAWWTNVIRDPRVRMKIGGTIYEMTVVLDPDWTRGSPIPRRGGPTSYAIRACA